MKGKMSSKHNGCTRLINRIEMKGVQVKIVEGISLCGVCALVHGLDLDCRPEPFAFPSTRRGVVSGVISSSDAGHWITILTIVSDNPRVARYYTV